MRSALFAVMLAFGLGTGLAAATPQIRLQVGVTGTNTLTGLDDPVKVVQIPEVSKLLQDIADKPRSAGYIRSVLKDSDVDLKRLLALDLIKKFDGAYAINFNYLTLEDHSTLVRVLTPYADQFAQIYRDRWGDFKAIFAKYDAPGVPAGEVAYAVIGAMSLDWDGLDITAAKDLRITADKLPAGRSFVLWAKEQSPAINVKELYWGSHNETVNGVRFTSFGDHHTFPRLAFPDLLWTAAGRIASIEDAPRQIGLGVNRALQPYYVNDFLRDLGLILRQLRTGARTVESIAAATGIARERAKAILSLLNELRYADEDDGTFTLTTPYFSVADKPMIDAARSLSRQIVSEWLDRDSSSIEASLSGLTALKYGVPYKQLYTEIWHYIFGLTNKALVKSRHFADPYAEERLSKGIIPFAFDTETFSAKTELRY